MWAISKVKEIGNGAFHRNYWKAVLVALVICFGVAGSGSSSFSASKIKDSVTEVQDLMTDDDDYSYDYYDGYGYDDFYDYDYDYDHHSDVSEAEILAIVGFIIGFAAVIWLVLMAVAIVLDVFIMNPLEVGGCKFFFENLKNPAQIKNLAYAFDSSYKNIINIMFFRDLYTFLWTLLFIIPGIVKSYEYRMIPYLLAENPNMTREEAFARSRYLMDGNKWNAFVFDLSFIGWYILCIIPFVGMFYVRPYKNSADAALYDAITLSKQNNFQGQPQNFQQGSFQSQPQNFQQGGFQGQPQNFQQGGFQGQPQNFQQGSFQSQPQSTQQMGNETPEQPQADASQMFVDESTDNNNETPSQE